jgi:MSHA biogenesis protein MshJ
MTSFWMLSRTKYMALARRERVLMVAAAVALFLGLGTLLFIEPAFRQGTQLKLQMEQQRKDLDALRPQVLVLLTRQRDPDGVALAQLNALRRQLQLADSEFAQVQSALVQPQEMGHLLDSLLQSHRGLQLISLRSVPVMSVSELIAAPKSSAANALAPAASAAGPTANANAAAKDAWLYRHGVEITVQGSYADMQAYLAALENLPRRVYWGELKIDARQWPANVMMVTVYTISLEKTWWRV